MTAVDSPPLFALWVDDWIYLIWLALGCVWVPLLFPDGRLPSPRWRPFVWCRGRCARSSRWPAAPSATAGSTPTPAPIR